ncbi:outer membrane protein assembly factor BamC [Pseudoalteromonas viridis]|uniref:Outer membrane protein assembly factor BamC n=1 Tax=Pseudoalteromonas viridis TaxID=339617 RepID=A0ABX7V329_9GAMM|nr:outer membrane protein assembly factor BamC [Pseudoalteromonas viridis]QTL35288.1 outer membrane protein assembly factor BamC [Pseudoalteromonas viridis]
MQYWVPKALALGVLLGLTGCSVFPNDAHHSKNYRVNEGINVPDGLEQPYQDPKYKMAVAVYDNNSDSDAKLYRPPQQVLTLAQGSWAESKDKVAKVYFDKNDGIEDLSVFIWESLDGVLVNHNTGIVKDARQEGTIETDWYSLIRKDEGWLWEDIVEVSRQRFAFTVEQKEHQRTASLTAKLLDYQSDEQPLTDTLKQQLEVRALNEVIAEFDYRYRLLAVELRKQQGLLSLQGGFDQDGNAAMLTLVEKSAVMDRLSNFLERVNFTVIRLDRDIDQVKIRYEAPDQSVWDSIWGEEATVLPLADGDYIVKVSTTDDGQTALTWLDSEEQVLDAQTMELLLQSLLEVLRSRGLQI